MAMILGGRAHAPRLGVRSTSPPPGRLAVQAVALFAALVVAATLYRHSGGPGTDAALLTHKQQKQQQVRRQTERLCSCPDSGRPAS